MVAAYTGSSDPSMTVISTEHGPASASKDGTPCLLLLSAPPSGVLRKVIAMQYNSVIISVFNQAPRSRNSQPDCD
jgi:hypothetical protein